MTFAEHFSSVGAHLDKSVAAYNKSVGSLDHRVLPHLRKFQDLGAAGTKELAEPEAIEKTAVGLSAAEIRPALPLAEGGEA